MAVNSFNYNKFHFFDKNGHELMLRYDNKVIIKLVNESHISESVVYALFTNGHTLENSTLQKISTGARYGLSEGDSIKVVSSVNGVETEANLPSQFYNIVEYVSSNGIENYPEVPFNTWTVGIKADFLSAIGLVFNELPFPSSTFEANLVFDKVSTELVETQSLYILVDDETQDEYNKRLVDVSTYAKNSGSILHVKDFVKEFQLFFFIDCRDQNDFRFFDVDSDEVIWSDRHFVHLINGTEPGPDNGYRVDIGFSGENEGVYDQKLYMCLADASNGVYEDGSIYIVGKINMTAETEGFDERYETLFTNFGLPGAKETEQMFVDSNDLDELPDYTKINKHAKKTFLSYQDIFPYVGSYKALFNAVKLLGYDDIFFKEWYKELGASATDERGLIAFDVSTGSTKNSNTITNKTIEERIHLRKLNWLSMMYKMSEQTDDFCDQQGFPTVISRENYYSRNNIVKLISLKKWLEKYIIGVNSRITDVGGEGIVFERYSMPKYGSYQQVFDYTNERSIAAKINGNSFLIKDASANIKVNVSTSDEIGMIEDYPQKTFYDFAEGKFVDEDSSWKFVELDSSIEDSSTIYFGRSCELHDNMNTIEFKVKGVVDSIRFGESLVDSMSPGLIIDDNKIFFDPTDLLTKSGNVCFLYPPIIEIKDGKIKRLVYGDVDTKADKTASTGTITYNKKNDECTIVFSDGTQSVTVGRKFTFAPPVHMDLFESASSVKLSSVVNDSSIIITDEPYKNIRTYGLRYTRDTDSNVPEFRISEYTSIDIPTYPDYSLSPEYTVEIKSGRMIFNDPENNRKIIVIFDYIDGKSIITTKVLQHSNSFTSYKYLVNKNNNVWVNRFTPNKYYTDFVGYYDASSMEAINDNTECDVNVKNAGTYVVDAILCDQWNNMFSRCAGKDIYVVTRDIDASTYSHDSSSNNDYNIIGVPSSDFPFISEDVSTCIYEYCAKRPVIDASLAKYKLCVSGKSDGTQKDYCVEHVIDSREYDYCRVANTNTRMDCSVWNSGNGEMILIDTYKRNNNIIPNYTTDSYYKGSIIFFDNSIEHPALICDCSISAMGGNPDGIKMYKLTGIPSDCISEITSMLSNKRFDILVQPDWELSLNVSENIISSLGENIQKDNVYKIKLKSTSSERDRNSVTEFCGIFSTKLKDGNIIDTSVSCSPDEIYLARIYPGSETYAATSLKIDKKDSSFGERIISMEDGDSKEKSYFIDKTFGLSFMNFDIDNGFRMWADIPSDEQLYTYNAPITTYSDSVIIKPLLGEAFDIIPETYSVHWKIFKQYGTHHHRLLLECWNKVVALKFPDEGTYDIDLTVYDENGNKYNKFLDGIITYKKEAN